jgi:hypothetical protein
LPGQGDSGNTYTQDGIPCEEGGTGGGGFGRRRIFEGWIFRAGFFWGWIFFDREFFGAGFFLGLEIFLDLNFLEGGFLGRGMGENNPNAPGPPCGKRTAFLPGGQKKAVGRVKR